VQLVWKPVWRTLMFIAVLFTVFKLSKQPRYLTTDEWVKKI
jgi:hypothetical protein